MNYGIDLTRLNGESQDNTTPLPSEHPFSKRELKILSAIYKDQSPIRDIAKRFRCSMRNIYEVKEKLAKEYPYFELVIQAELGCYQTTVTLEYSQVLTCP